MPQLTREEKAEEIVHHFFSKGARVDVNDLNYVREAMSFAEQQAYGRVIEMIPEEYTKEEIYGELEGDYRFIAYEMKGFNDCRENILSAIKSLAEGEK